MRKLPVLITLCLFVFPAAAQSEKGAGFPCRTSGKEGQILSEIWQPIEVSGQIEFGVGTKNGKPFIGLPVIEKDGILYKLHIPMPFLEKEGIRSGDTVTVTGKGRPSAWTKDLSVSVVVMSVKTGETEKKVLWPSRGDSPPHER